ncbi:hypothetical protein [Streptomyces sp. LNU-CPARS28]|uniref:hypothetical protein n=1 Tax=Streptomyces sp. LNU-CPARS28 TaxID=3137371 RepID=UPI003136D4A2
MTARRLPPGTTSRALGRLAVVLDGVNPSRARTGIALGTAAIVLPLALLLWVMWEMSKV